MKEIIKLKLKEAIILEDARRIREGIEPINNIRRLALEMERLKPKMYKSYNLDKWLYRAYHIGIFRIDRTYIMNEVIKDLCELLRTSREQLVKEEVL